MAMAPSTQATSRKEASTAISSSVFMVLLFTILQMGYLTPSPLVQAATPEPPSEITVYLLSNFTDPTSFLTVVLGYNGTPAAPGFGALNVFDLDLRLANDLAAPVIGQLTGQVINLRGTSIYIDFAFGLSTPSYSGTITAQYLGQFLVSGEGSVTGGTEDFRYARGYLYFDVMDKESLEAVVFSTTFHLVYDTI